MQEIKKEGRIQRSVRQNMTVEQPYKASEKTYKEEIQKPDKVNKSFVDHEIKEKKN